MLIRELVREQACSGVLFVVPYLKWAEQHILLKGGWAVENFVRLLRILRNRTHVRCGGERDCNAVLKFGIRATAHKNSQRGSGFLKGILFLARGACLPCASLLRLGFWLHAGGSLASALSATLLFAAVLWFEVSHFRWRNLEVEISCLDSDNPDF